MSGEPRAIRSAGVLRGGVLAPGSKSVTQRYLNLALVGGCDVVIEAPLVADDTAHFAGGLEVAGLAIERHADRWVVAPTGDADRGGEIFCGHGGTMMRFLVAALATRPGVWVIDGSPRLRQRPLAPLLGALRALGVDLECLGEEGFPPVRVRGGTLYGGGARLDAGESSQYLSALLMAALAAAEPVELEVTALASAPYVDLTVRAISHFGGRVERSGTSWRVQPTTLVPGRVRVEGDWSAASYWLAGAALTAGEVRLDGLDEDSLQGDRAFLEVVERLGATSSWRDGSLVVRGGTRLHAVQVDQSAMPDLVPTLAVVAPFARGTTRITNVAHLRIKESDRLAAMSRELARCGAAVAEQRDGLVIEGGWATAAPPNDPVTVSTYDDHRIAMSMALLGLRRPGISIAQPGVVAKSYPAFWQHFDALLDGA